MAQEQFDVSIVMPCLNEIEALPFALEYAIKAKEKLSTNGFTTEIIVADNGSTETAVSAGFNLEL